VLFQFGDFVMPVAAILVFHCIWKIIHAGSPGYEQLAQRSLPPGMTCEGLAKFKLKYKLLAFVGALIGLTILLAYCIWDMKSDSYQDLQTKQLQGLRVASGNYYFEKAKRGTYTYLSEKKTGEVIVRLDLVLYNLSTPCPEDIQQYFNQPAVVWYDKPPGKLARLYQMKVGNELIFSVDQANNVVETKKDDLVSNQIASSIRFFTFYALMIAAFAYYAIYWRKILQLYGETFWGKKIEADETQGAGSE